MIRDIHNGTLSSNFEIAPQIRQQLRWGIGSPNRERAQELELIAARTGTLRPCDVWPKLGMVAVWTGGSVGAYLEPMRRYWGDVPIRDHGLSASEGRMTIPLSDGTCTGVLDISSHFFEFIPEEEYESSQPTILEAHELNEGRNYFILLTTVSGLYRYDIRDVVRCTGFVGDTPLLEFLHKGANIASVTGEKLAESQVVSAVRGSLNRLKLELQHFTLSPISEVTPLATGCISNMEIFQRATRTSDWRRTSTLNCRRVMSNTARSAIQDGWALWNAWQFPSEPGSDTFATASRGSAAVSNNTSIPALYRAWNSAKRCWPSLPLRNGPWIPKRRKSFFGS